MPRPIPTSAFVAALLLTVSQLFAWGGEGHQVVALIAEERLTEKTQSAIHELLGDDVNISDAEIASWADQIKRERRRTSPWHYVNIPFDSEGLDLKRDGSDGNNIVDRIQSFQKLLADTSKSKEARVEALKFLVHLVGDIHQPLHCVDRAGDKGGNGRLCFLVEVKGKATNLHSVWDTALLRRYVGRTPIADYAATLNAAITRTDEQNWEQGDASAWADESWKQAKAHVYRGVPADGPPPVLSQEYIDDARPVVDSQLQHAGIRLAMILNTAFASHQTAPATQRSETEVTK